jgi:hypothetical protein
MLKGVLAIETLEIACAEDVVELSLVNCNDIIAAAPLEIDEIENVAQTGPPLEIDEIENVAQTGPPIKIDWIETGVQTVVHQKTVIFPESLTFGERTSAPIERNWIEKSVQIVGHQKIVIFLENLTFVESTTEMIDSSAVLPYIADFAVCLKHAPPQIDHRK